MDIATGIGLIAGIGTVVSIILIDGGNFAAYFDKHAPRDVKSFAPPFIGSGTKPANVQLWTGLIARTAPGWSLLVRAPANLPRSRGYDLYEGIVETDRWFGPLFTNMRLARTDGPIEISRDYARAYKIMDKYAKLDSKTMSIV